MPVYLLMIAGAVLRRTRVLPRECDVPVMQLVYRVMLPCFMLDKILGSAVLRSGPVVVWSIFIGFGMIMVGILCGLGIGKLIGLERGTGMRTFALSSGCQNFGFTAAPVIEILWGAGALSLLFVHNIGVEVAMWSVGVMMMSGERSFSWKRLVNGPVIAVAVGLALVALGLDGAVTGSFRKAMSMVGVGAFPVAIVITGCTMMDLLGTEKMNWKVIGGSAVVRLMLAPAAMLCAAKFLPLTTELRQVLVVQAAMPAGLSSILIARLYGGRPAVAVQVVIATTVLSFLTLPWIITWGSAWIGLKPLLP
ncbi:AEC family transporter [Luteolibacter yonseiensis]|uniref:AEC family transporter n=2 Tax=Luteolibacter yonseiensis TaxID=1144680 RepID=A0A934V9I6_9BACT|nr:AEC family transporter [Luteolibacter yonseiensis]